MGKNGQRLLILALVALAIAWFVEHRRAERAQRDSAAAELQAGLRASDVLSARFDQTGELRAARLQGEVLSQGACKSAYVFATTQQTVAPYTAEYMVDLSRIDRSSFRWNAGTRTLFVQLPGVTVEPPAIDLSRARSRQGGAFISRACGMAMQAQIAGRLQAAAADRARRPDYLNKAADSARIRVAALMRSTLAAAGLGDIDVRVRLASDPALTDDARWDMSRPVEEVLRAKP